MGIYIFFISLRELLNVLNITRNGVRVKGRIIGLIKDDQSEYKQFYPVIEYTLPAGQVVQGKSSHSWIEPKINQELEILYHRDKPEKIIVDKFFFKYFGSITGIIISVVSIVMGIVNLL